MPIIKSVTILYDPIPYEDGGLSGKSFPGEEHKCMLNMGSYTPGTILCEYNGRVKIVVAHRKGLELKVWHGEGMTA